MSGRILLARSLFLATTALAASAQTHATDRGSIIIAGLLFMVPNAVGINPSLYYQNTKTSFTNANGEIEGKTNTFGLAVGISAFVF